MLSTRFKIHDLRNSLYFSYNLENNPNYYYNFLISDFEKSIYYTLNTKCDGLYIYLYDKVFKYDIKMLRFDGQETKIIEEKKFDINNHNFNINLKSKDNNELKIWENYLSLLELNLNVKFNVTINGNLENIKDEDYVEISRERFDSYLKQTPKALSGNYSSLNIIKNLFDII